MKRGDVYSSEKWNALSKNFFPPRKISLPRELALRQVAERLTAASNPTWKRGHPEKLGGARAPCLADFIDPSELLDRSRARMAAAWHAELLLVHVDAN